MKIVLDNIIYAKENNGGISNYWYHITDFLLNETSDEIAFFDVKNPDNFQRNKLLHEIENRTLKTDKANLWSRALPITHNISDTFIYHSSFYRKLIGVKNQVEITTVHDFTHDYYFPYIKRKLHNLYKYSAIKRSKGIICVSKNTYSDLKKFCNPSKEQNIEVIYNGVSPLFKKIDQFSANQLQFITKNKLDTNYLLYIGSRAMYKNFMFTVQLLVHLPHLQLVIVGNPLSENEKKKIAPELLSRIIVLSGLNNEELNIVYNRAFTLVYPSSYEGFGIPLIEAMRAECPVIALNNSSISEVAEKGAVLLHKLDTTDFAQAVIRLENQAFKTELLANGVEQSSKFSWEKCCNETYSFYQEVFSTQ